MKLEAILGKLNSLEKNAFLKIIDGIIADNPKNAKEIEKTLTDKNKELKNADAIIIVKIFNLVREEFEDYVKVEFVNTSSQLDILTDIIIRDGNCIMKRDWLARLYEKELKKIEKKARELNKSLMNGKSDLDEQRKRDYLVYKSCLETAYTNDEDNNQDRKVTSDELSILLTLHRQLELSQEEAKLLNYMILPVVKFDIDVIINELRNAGVIFYDKDVHTVYVADEMVRIMRQIRGKEVADKHFRRILRRLKPNHLNLICRKHNIDWKLPADQKIKEIINEGISLTGILTNDIYKEDTNLTERKKFITDLSNRELKISPALKGITLEEKVANLVSWFEDLEKDDKVGISVDGYEKLLMDLSDALPKLNSQLKAEFELQEEHVLSSDYLLSYNFKPRDVLDLLGHAELTKFCSAKGISVRGDEIVNILKAYKDTKNLYIENYENIGYRNLTTLKENGIKIRESELGIKFEDLTKAILTRLGFQVDEKLRKSINTKKDKIDILLNLGNNDLILVECKTIKESKLNRFSSVSRQLKAYINLAKSNGYRVIKTLLIAPEFSEDFISECELVLELNPSLITASSLINILDGFKKSKHKLLPYNLFMKDVLIQEDRVLKAIRR